ncbi:MAG: D-alanine--D-alanine ligase [Chloroflexi bacterium]|nr:D-alanine--D-alanine ligase [Chloroflexota bacterium]MCY4247726.1 D-alanine--D-alanine ligase [Chloroflexota bacterium]
MSSRRSAVAVLFGGRSVEHDVSIVTGQQIMAAFPADRYETVPVYITRDGRWVTGAPLRHLNNFRDDALLEKPGIEACLLSPDTRHHGLLINPLAGRFSRSRVQRIDVVFPALHGSHGEDGSLQGLLELADIPYIGCATLGSALGNDKIMTKLALRQAGLPVLDDMWVAREAWAAAPDAIVAQIRDRFDFPIFIKPACLGSSIGIGRASDEALLRASIDVAASFDRRILVEPALTDSVEINCAVMGYGDEYEASPLEQPLGWDDFLSYDDKYMRGAEGMKSADRIIPAPIDDELAARIQALSIAAFQAVDGRGIARIDYLARPQAGEVYLNEINTMPGSLAFYLWHEAGYSRAQVLERLVQLGRAAHADKRRNTYDYPTSLVSIASQRGSKGVKRKG